MTTASPKDDINNDNVVQGAAFAEHPIQDYSSDDTTKLLGAVFHGLEEGEEIAVFHTRKGQPSYPTPVDTVIRKIDSSKHPTAFYYGTASLTRDKDGAVFNRKSQFSALHVVVLDDIGTKVSLDDLPEELEPNYIIESSKGNYQYGFILKEPIRDVALADALIHLVYTSGVSDAGGKLVTKAVRLPAGVNCKRDTDKFLDPVSLIELNDHYWTPEELLDVLDLGVTWEQVVEDPSKITQAHTKGVRSLSAWSPAPVVSEGQGGIVDPMLEFLYDEKWVVNDAGHGWVTIKCPWHDSHTSGSDTAGYSPLGRGDDEFHNRRGFKCQHEHCSMHDTSDFLTYMSGIHGPEVPVYDEAAYLTRDYVFDVIGNTAVRVANVNTPFAVPLAGFRNANNKATTVYTFEGKAKRVSMATLWEHAPHRVVVAGSSYDPTAAGVIVTDDHGIKRLNTFVEPTWGDGAYDQSDVDMFLSIARYLIPIEEEFDYFMQWLAAKASERSFKGNAILMVATTQGIGRTMFSDLIAELFTPSNCGRVKFADLVQTGGFNEWNSNLMVFCDEVMTDRSQLYRSYETLKDLFDPRPKPVEINRKYGTKSVEVNYSSYLLLTNHAGALGALRGDRRIYAISNPQQRQPPSFYSDIDKWSKIRDTSGAPKWAISVWRWLRKQKYDIEMLSSPVPETAAKDIMQDETDSVEEVIIRWCFENIHPCLPSNVVRMLGVQAIDAEQHDSIELMKHFKPAMGRMTLNAKGFKNRLRVNGVPELMRVYSESVACGDFPSLIVANEKEINEQLIEGAGVVNKMLADKDAHAKVIYELAQLVRGAV